MQIISPLGMKLDKSTNPADEGGAGVIEAILAWWNAVRTGNGEDTSAVLFKKSAALAGQERDLFVESLQRTGVFTALPCSPGTRAPVATASASPPNDQACSSANTLSPAGSPRAATAAGPAGQHGVCDLVS